MPEKPGHVWVPFLGASGVFWVLSHVIEVGKGRGSIFLGAGTTKYL
jgi:hypothetical protein